MAKNYIDLERIEGLSEKDKKIELAHKAIKLSEETGEFSQAMLKFLGSKNVSKSADSNNIRSLVLEELCDTINVAADLINAIGFTDEECYTMFQKKLDKWESKQKNY